MPSGSGPDQQLAIVLRDLPERHGRTQEALAHDAGLSVASYRRIERGLTNPGWTSVVAILDALGVSLSDLARELEKRR
jgi:transcriptional regulator with XRE-family HTH domain